MSQVPGVQALPAGLATLADHDTHARTVLDANAWAYFSGTAGDGLTAAANREAWDALRLLPRVLQPLAGGHTHIELLGRTLAHPVLVAPMAYQKLAHADGELATALAASAQGAGMVLSTQASMRLETVAKAVAADAGRGPLWFQLYLQAERAATLELVRRAEAAGYEALVLTVDASVQGSRDAERRAGFRLPLGISAVNLAPAAGPAAQGGSLFESLLSSAPTWQDLEWLLSQTRLPVLVKGILHAADARQAARLSVAGVIVSNHGGRTLDTVPSTASMLPHVVQAVKSIDARIPVLVDGGIRRGTDVLKALSLGAAAVLVGRPVLWGLANAGAVGVAHVLRLLRDELEIAMALCGVATLDQLPDDLLMGAVARQDKP